MKKEQAKISKENILQQNSNNVKCKPKKKKIRGDLGLAILV